MVFFIRTIMRIKPLHNITIQINLIDFHKIMHVEVELFIFCLNIVTICD